MLLKQVSHSEEHEPLATCAACNPCVRYELSPFCQEGQGGELKTNFSASIRIEILCNSARPRSKTSVPRWP
jgi:hypothetical protein